MYSLGNQIEPLESCNSTASYYILSFFLYGYFKPQLSTISLQEPILERSCIIRKLVRKDDKNVMNMSMLKNMYMARYVVINIPTVSMSCLYFVEPFMSLFLSQPIQSKKSSWNVTSFVQELLVHIHQWTLSVLKSYLAAE